MLRSILLHLVMIPALAACTMQLNPLSQATSPTPDPTTTAIIATVQASVRPEIALYESPDGTWRVGLVMFACTPTDMGDAYAYETLRLAQADDDAATVVDSQLINCGGLGAFGLDGLFWSADSRYFYYTTAREGVPDGCGDWQPPIRCMDVASGTSEAINVDEESPDAAALTTWLEQHQVWCAPSL